jgi:hypothetical protein
MRKTSITAKTVLATASVLALGTAAMFHTGHNAPGFPSGAAFAQAHDDGSGHEGGPHGPGGPGSGHDGEGGHDGGPGGGHDGGGHDGGSGGQGPGGPGGSAGAGSGSGHGASGRGGRPPWAAEGIPNVELGRLNVSRSPVQVLDRAFVEALASITPEMVDFYNQDLSEIIADLSLNWGSVSFIDSPVQNLALLRDALAGGSALAGLGVTTDTFTLMAVYLGTAADKNIPITTETALAVSIILGNALSPAEAAELAAAAEQVRIAILAGHG